MTLWRDLGPNFANRTHRVRSAMTGEVTLTGSELLDLCAAIELDRVQRADVVELLTQRRTSKEPLRWLFPLTRKTARGREWKPGRPPERDLMDGARGLKPSDAYCTMSVSECLARVGVELIAEQRRTGT